VVRTGVASDAPVVAASGTDLLLWLYQRAELATPGVDATMIARFRDLTYTD
jgi:hypothetical protein